MNMFEGKNSKKIEYLEVERKKLWDRILALEKKIDEKPSDIEKEAKQASKKTAEYRNKAEDRLNKSIEILKNISETKQNIDNISEEITKSHEQVNNELKKSKEESDEISNRSNELFSLISKISEFLSDYPDLEDKIEELGTEIEEIEETASKANTTYKGILSRKSEIDELYREIVGYEDEDAEGEMIIVEGLRAELETSFNSLSKKAIELDEKLDNIDKLSSEQYLSFVNNNKDDLEKIKTDSKTEYNSVLKRIKSLLPDAMTAGLSSAFITKKKEEEVLYKEYKSKFNWGIILLSLVSLLPITISIFFLTTSIPLIEVIEKSPRIILSFMPLYIPLIWITISANKKVNLSKRLIEEYSHKQVLSMTIEGLSNQINDIEDDGLSQELRAKLLNSFLMVTSENPGKLISNYQKSDNPFFNLFDRDGKDRKKTMTETFDENVKDFINKTTDVVTDTVVKSVKID